MPASCPVRTMGPLRASRSPKPWHTPSPSRLRGSIIQSIVQERHSHSCKVRDIQCGAVVSDGNVIATELTDVHIDEVHRRRAEKALNKELGRIMKGPRERGSKNRTTRNRDLECVRCRRRSRRPPPRVCRRCRRALTRRPWQRPQSPERLDEPWPALQTTRRVHQVRHARPRRSSRDQRCRHRISAETARMHLVER